MGRSQKEVSYMAATTTRPEIGQIGAAPNGRVAAPRAALTPQRRSRLYWAFSDTIVVAKRNLMHIPRIPMMLLDVTIQPIIFVVLFRFVFGGAVNTGDVSYVNFLMPGIFVQTLIFACMTTGVGMAEDLHRGLIDRFRSLPMARSAVLAGRTIADLAQSVLGLVVMLSVGMLVGFRPQGGAVNFIAAIALMLLCSFAFCWIGVTLGLVASTAETVQAVGFVLIFPLTFASSAFVPTESMPGWLQVFTKHQPVTLIVNAVRSLFLDRPFGTDGWLAVAWLVGILVVFAPISVTIYRKKTVR
jgi:ABC-2 type transport system permease protein/oleandomycin transport system permease protein